MVDQTTANEVISKIREEPSNNLCADCSSPDIKFISVSHGTFICEPCALIHQSLTSHISFIKSINDTWSIRQLKLLTVGGNKTLKTFFSTYEISESSTIRFKYHTLAAKYYREMLKVMAEGEPCTMQTPSIEEGKTLIVDPSLVYTKERAKIEEEKSESSVSSLFSSAFSTTLGLGKNLYGKVLENEKFRDVEQKAKDAMFKVGQGIVRGARMSASKIEWAAGVDLGKKGMSFLTDGALGAFDSLTSSAAYTYEKISVDERTKRIKEESMNFLIGLENKTFGFGGKESVDENN